MPRKCATAANWQYVVELFNVAFILLPASNNEAVWLSYTVIFLNTKLFLMLNRFNIDILAYCIIIVVYS